MLNEALKKLDPKVATGQKEKVMAPAVAAVLKDFCEQDAEFAQAVAQGGSFKDCMTAVAKGVGGSISDIDAYKKAVQFYFPGAEIRVQMSIDLVGSAAEQSLSQPAADSSLKVNCQAVKITDCHDQCAHWSRNDSGGSEAGSEAREAGLGHYTREPKGIVLNLEDFF